MLLQVTNFHSSLWLSNIPLCVNTMSSSSIYLYPGVDGHSGYFCILAFIDNNIVNVGVCVSFQINILFFFFFNVYPGVELLNHLVVVFLVF